MGLDRIILNPVYQNTLDMRKFEQMLQSPTQSYKFYWLEAIVTLLPENDEFTFDEIVCEMIWEAWHTVAEYHLHLGPVIQGKSENYIEHAIHELINNSDETGSLSKDKFHEIYQEYRSILQPDINGLIKYVPYRLLSSFFTDIKGNDSIWNQRSRLIQYIKLFNQDQPLPYIIEDGPGPRKKVCVETRWRQLILDNYPIILDWIQMKKIRFLQDRNPGVPGIVYKLKKTNADQRKMKHVRELWKAFSEVSNNRIKDIYSNHLLDPEVLSMDHFIPWTYISNDEIWNLIPTSQDINSSKGDKLPDWDRFFVPFSMEQYALYRGLYQYSSLFLLFEKCRADNLNALWASELLYKPGHSESEFRMILEKNMSPVFEAAKLQGFRTWEGCVAAT